MNDRSRLVYSTQTGRIRPRDPVPEPVPAGDGTVRLRRETKGRKGKGVTLVDGVPESADALKSLARELKQLCGTGGSVKNGVIEIQGDQRERLRTALEARGYKVRLAGG